MNRLTRFKRHAFLFIGMLAASSGVNLYAGTPKEYKTLTPAQVKEATFTHTQCDNEWIVQCNFTDCYGNKWSNSVSGKNKGVLKDECTKSMSKQGSAIDIRSGNHIHTATEWDANVSTSSCSSCSGGSSVESTLDELGITRYHMYRLMTHQSSLSAGEFLSWDVNLTFYEEGNGNIGVRLFDPAKNGDTILHNRNRIRSYFEGTFRKFDRLDVFDINGVKLDTKKLDKFGDIAKIDSATLVKLDGSKLNFEVFEGQSGTLLGRLISLEDLNGYKTTFSYEEAYDANLVDETEKWKLTKVTDVNGRELDVTYNATKISNRWAIKDISVPNGSKIEYEYGTTPATNDYEKLVKVKYPDLTESTIARITDGAYTRVDYFEAGATGTHRKKSAYMSGSASFGPGMIGRESIGGVVLYTTASNILRFLTNGNDEVAYLITSEGDQSGKKRVYEGAGTLRNANLQDNTYIKDGWDYDATKTSTGDDRAVFTDATPEDQGYSSDKVGARKLIPDWAKFEDGRECEYFYDTTPSQQRLTMKIWDKAAGAAGGVSEWRYNNFSQVTAYSDRLGRVSLYEYDANGNLTKKTVGWQGDIDAPTAGTEAAEFNYEYHTALTDADNVNLLRYSFDANNNRTEFIYNSDHQVVEIKEPDDIGSGYHTAQTFTYELNSKRLSTATDASDRITTYTYDNRDRVIQATYHDTSTELTTFGTGVDSNLVVSTTDRDGNRTDFEYDASGRVIKTTGGANAVSADQRQVTTITYINGTSRVLTKTTNGEVTEYEYDYRKRLVGTTVYPKDGTELTSTITMVDNLLFCKEDPYGRKTYYSYRDSDKALVRAVQGTNTNFSLVDFAAVDALARDLSNNADYLITDYTLDLAGQTTATIDSRGITYSSTYDLRGRMLTSTEASSDLSVAATTTTTYDANSNVLTVTDPETNVKEIAYTRRNMQASVTVGKSSAVETTMYQTYLDDGRVDETTDFEGNVTKSIWHDCCGRIQASVDALGHGTIINNSYAGDVTHVVVAKNIYDYSGPTVLTSDFHNPDAADTISETTNRYDERHRLIASTNWLVKLDYVNPNSAPIAGDVGYPAADGLTTTYTYYDDVKNATALEITAVLAKLPASYFGLNSTGSAVVRTNPNDEKTVTVVDGTGRTIIAGALDSSDAVKAWNITQYDAYDATEDLLMTKSTNALGNTWTSYVDSVGRTQISQDPLLNRSTMEYDANSNLVKSRDANGVGIDCLFDSRNRDYSCTDTQGDTVTKVFDDNNNITTSTDSNLKTTTSVYDARNRLTSITDRISAETKYTYDDNSNLLTVEDAETKVTTYKYSARNELIKTTYPDHILGKVAGDLDYGITECAFDEVGRKSLCTDQKGDMIQYKYDMLSRMTDREYFTLGADPSIDTPDNTDTFTYDLASRLLTGYKDKYNNTVTFFYDEIGRSEKQRLSYISKLYDVEHAFDNASRITSCLYPDSTTITNAYTVRNQLNTQYIGLDLVADYDYDAGARETRREFGNGLVTTKTFGRSDNLATAIDVTSNTNLSTAYTYDANKNVLTETRGGNMSGTGFTATYDFEDRVKTWARDNGTETQTWNLSDVGDWVDTTIDGVLQSRTHTNAHEVDSIGGAPLTYDANGNMTTDEAGNIYTWDKDNHLVKIQDSGLVVLAEYVYDAFGKRIGKTKSGSTTVFVHSGNQVVCEYDSLAALTNPSRVYVFSGGYIDDPVLAIDSSSDWFFHHLNRQFNVYGMTDDTGAVSELYSYDVYGK